MTVGLMGSDSHILNYTVFGREVNLASRLEGVSGRGRIIIGETTFLELKERLPDLAKRCIQLAPVAVKGFRQPVPIYEVPWRELTEGLLPPTPDTVMTTE
jgi:class 3 adenylate cyclase